MLAKWELEKGFCFTILYLPTSWNFINLNPDAVDASFRLCSRRRRYPHCDGNECARMESTTLSSTTSSKSMIDDRGGVSSLNPYWTSSGSPEVEPK